MVQIAMKDDLLDNPKNSFLIEQPAKPMRSSLSLSFLSLTLIVLMAVRPVSAQNTESTAPATPTTTTTEPAQTAPTTESTTATQTPAATESAPATSEPPTTTTAPAQTETAPVRNVPAPPPAPAPVITPTREFVIVSGGPALRYYEHEKKASHDKYWGNFIDAAVTRFNQLQPQLQPGEKITWLVFRPGYVERSAEMVTELLPVIMEKANKANVNLLWFDRSVQVVNYLNHGKDRKTTPVVLFEYFGHSNKACFLFDYSNDIDGMSTTNLHVRDISDINKTALAPTARSKSWGCHSGELYSEVWKKHFGTPMEGAIGKTDYSHGGLPFLSSDQGRWTQ